MTDPGSPRTRRMPLDRTLVISAGVEIADDGGIGAVSMRSVADHLDVVPMALYKHIANKEDLLDGMVDAVIAEFGDHAHPVDSSADWRLTFRQIVLRARRVVQSHRWVMAVIETRTRRTPAVLGHMELLTQVLLDGGLSADLIHHVMHVFGSRIWGFSPELFDESAQDSERKTTSAPPNPSDYPGIMQVVADANRRRPGAGCDEEFEFTFALDLILDGVARLAAQRSAG
ncbi:TetR/AcrR family transcriptional regulator [Gordonia sp. NPDC003429]